MKKLKKIGLLGLTTVTSLAVSTTTLLASCATKDETNTEPTKIVENGITYYILNFVKPTGTEYDDVTLVGKTQVKIREGYPFGTIVPPRAILENYTLLGWAQQGSTELITPTTPINSAMNIVPVMDPVGANINVEGENLLYDGFFAHPTYTATLDIGDVDQIVWTIETTEGEPSDALTLDTYTGGTVVATVNHTEEPVNCKVVATLGTGEDAISDFVLVTIYPPYYRSDEVTISTGAGTSETLDTGNLYWLSNYQAGSYNWVAAKPEEVCSLETWQTITIYNFAGNEGAGATSVESRDSLILGYLQDIYPGSEIGLIDDGCFANVTFFNAQMHGGVYPDGTIKIIGDIGDYFLYNCVNYNQNIDDTFTFDSPLAIGSHFLDGCSSFNNGAAPSQATTIRLPSAIHIGNSFMNDCSGLCAAITLPTEVRFIGDYFMNGCTNVTSLTIPADADDNLDSVGTWFMSDCTNLEQIHLYCSNINFMTDRFAELTDKGAFVKFGAATSTTQYIYVDGVTSAVNDLLNYYPNVTTETYFRNFIQGSIGGVTVIVPAKGTQEYTDMFEPVVEKVGTGTAFSGWTGTFKNIKITSPEPIGTITASLETLNYEREFIQNVTVEEVAYQQLSNGDYQKTINIVCKMLDTTVQKKKGYNLRMTLYADGQSFFSSTAPLYKVDKRLKLLLPTEERITVIENDPAPKQILKINFNYVNELDLPPSDVFNSLSLTEVGVPTGLMYLSQGFTYDVSKHIYTVAFHILSSSGYSPAPGNYSFQMSMVDGVVGYSNDYIVKPTTVSFTILPTIMFPTNYALYPRYEEIEPNTYRFYISNTFMDGMMFHAHSQPLYDSEHFWVTASLPDGTTVTSTNLNVTEVTKGVIRFRPEFIFSGITLTGHEYDVTLRFYSSYKPGENKLIATKHFTYILKE